MRCLLVALLLLFMTARAEAGELDHRWGLTQGLMAGVVVSHGVQPLAVAFGDLEWRPKHAVAIAGTGLYGTALVGHLLRERWSLYIAVIGPATGLTTILGVTALDALGVTRLGVRPDSFQLAGAMLQLPAAILALGLLRDTRATVLPTASAGGGGLSLVVRF